ncbi:Dynein heavy chain 10 like protein [Argiope bruennichi]|uniref:Dynein heavy chain 10 like protein n=2 Tax=Argiope bruennichi TaxID=94029 RepID=A0A8T0G235_ARGBR|nr:Dynein heavy chain 10 like protein [Argiope bruennichi]
MDDLRFEWIKDVIYRFLSINTTDEAFDDLIKRDESNQTILKNLFSDPKISKKCIFFYSDIVEEEIETEDAEEKPEETPKPATTSRSSHSSEGESDISSVASASKEKGSEDQVKIEDTESKSDDNESDENGSSKSGSEEKSDVTGEGADQAVPEEKSTTSLRLIVKKTKLYLLFHITKHVPDRGYVYFHRCKTEPIPSIDTSEEACKIMPQYFEIGFFSQHPIVCVNEMINSLYKPMFADENRQVHVSKEDYPVDETQITSLISDFNKEMTEFTDSTKQIISQIEKPFMFSLPQIPEDINLEELAQETEYVTEAEEMMDSWNSVLSDLYHEIEHENVPDNGLLHEVEFWKTQKLKLNICADQMGHPTIEKTIKILKLADRDVTKFEKNVKKIENLLKRTTDNVAYLSLLEKNAKISQITRESIEILQYWKKLYFEECEKVKKYGTSYWWRFDTRILFDETDHVISICEDLGRISTVLQELYNIFNTNLRFFAEDMKDLSVLQSRIFGMTAVIQYISETENLFIAQEREPPPLHAVPETASAILWARDLIIKISKPMSKIRDSFRMDDKDKEALARFMKTEKMLSSYQKEKYEAWKGIAQEKLNTFLQAHILMKFHPQSAKFINITRIKFILEELLDSLSDLKKEEISTLEIPIENLCSVLDLGVHQIQWESTDVPDFIKKSKQAVDIFRGFVNRIKNIVQEIDKNVKSLSTCDLFQFMKIEDSVPPCEAFFENARMNMEVKVQKMVGIYSSLEPLLKKLEMISCRTSSGRAPQMREYYYACEEKILKSLTKMMLLNLEYFKDEVMEQFLYPYVDAAFQSKDELITSSIIRIKLIFLTFMKSAMESTRKLKRWLDGTCIESKPFHITDKKIQMEFSYYLDLSMHPQIKKLVLVILSNFFAYVDKQKSE